MESAANIEEMLGRLASFAIGCVIGWVISMIIHSIKFKNSDVQSTLTLLMAITAGISGNKIYEKFPRYNWYLFLIGLCLAFFLYILFNKAKRRKPTRPKKMQQVKSRPGKVENDNAE